MTDRDLCYKCDSEFLSAKELLVSNYPEAVLTEEMNLKPWFAAVWEI